MSNVLLGIDLGEAKTGVAIAYETTLAQPLAVIHEKNTDRLVDKIKKLATQEDAEKIIVGLPEGPLAKLAHHIAQLLSKESTKVVLWDETLTTKDAQKLAIAAGIPARRRKALEDAFSAAVMLQSYLDGY